MEISNKTMFALYEEISLQLNEEEFDYKALLFWCWLSTGVMVVISSANFFFKVRNRLEKYRSNMHGCCFVVYTPDYIYQNWVKVWVKLCRRNYQVFRKLVWCWKSKVLKMAWKPGAHICFVLLLSSGYTKCGVDPRRCKYY